MASATPAYLHIPGFRTKSHPSQAPPDPQLPDAVCQSGGDQFSGIASFEAQEDASSWFCRGLEKPGCRSSTIELQNYHHAPLCRPQWQCHTKTWHEMLCKGIRAHAKVAWQCMELTPVLSSAAKAHCKAWFPPASQDLAATGPDPALQASQPAVTCFFNKKRT